MKRILFRKPDTFKLLTVFPRVTIILVSLLTFGAIITFLFDDKISFFDEPLLIISAIISQVLMIFALKLLMGIMACFQNMGVYSNFDISYLRAGFLLILFQFSALLFAVPLLNLAYDTHITS